MICSMITCQKQTSNVMLWSYSCLITMGDFSNFSLPILHTSVGFIKRVLLTSTSQPVHPVTHTYTHICLSVCVLIHSSAYLTTDVCLCTTQLICIPNYSCPSICLPSHQYICLPRQPSVSTICQHHLSTCLLHHLTVTHSSICPFTYP